MQDIENKLGEAISFFIDDKIDDGLTCLEEVSVDKKELAPPEGLSDQLNAKFYEAKGQYKRATEQYEGAYEAFTKMIAYEKEYGEPPEGLGNSYIKISLAHVQCDRFNEAIENFKTAEELLVNQSPNIKGTPYIEMGEIMYNKDKYILSAEYYKKAIEIFKLISDDPVQLGILYEVLGRYMRHVAALKFVASGMSRVMDEFSKISDTDDLEQEKKDIASVSDDAQQYIDETESVLLQTIDLKINGNDSKESLYRSYGTILRFYIDVELYDKAKEYYHKASHIAEELGDEQKTVDLQKMQEEIKES